MDQLTTNSPNEPIYCTCWEFSVGELNPCSVTSPTEKKVL